MAEEISLREANQNLAKYVKAVERGERRFLTPAQRAARRRALERMRRGWDLGGETFDRDPLHER